MNTIGQNLKLTSYGESHGESVGAILDGFPSNFKINLDVIQLALNRRRPGQSNLTTSRNESDQVRITSGVFEEKSTGAPIHFTIPNKDQKSKDYNDLKEVYRPSHADYTYTQKYGHRDFRGGGRSSARVTATWVAAGSLVLDYLTQKHGISINAYVKAIGPITLKKEYSTLNLNLIYDNATRCPDPDTSKEMEEAILNAKDENDSLGGVVECVISGLQPGIGGPVFAKLNALLGHAMFSINAVKGVEFGGGFDMAKRKGSQVNDEFVQVEGQTKTSSNNSGGIQGGISNGMDVVFRVAFKPTATIGKPQSTITKEGATHELQASGRHDVCVVPRAVPIVESMAALVLGDLLIYS